MNLIKLLAAILVLVISVEAEVCGAKYYLQKADLVTLTGNDIAKLKIESSKTITAYDNIPIIDTLINYKFPFTFTSSCDNFQEQPVQYLTRGKVDKKFSKSEEKRYIRFYTKVALGGNEAPWFIFKEDSNGSASEYFIYSTLSENNNSITGIYATGIRNDTLKDEFGSVTGYRISSIPWNIYLDSTNAWDYLSSQFNDTPPPKTIRRYTIQLLKVYYDSIKVDPSSFTKSITHQTGVNITHIGRSIQFNIPNSSASSNLISIFNLMGRNVRGLIVRNGTALWDGTDNRHSPLEAGLYLFENGSYHGKIYLLPKR